MVVEKGDNPPHEGDGRSHHSYTNLVRFSSTNLPLTTFDPFLNSAVCNQTVVMVRDIEEETAIDECDVPSLDGEHTCFPNSLFSDCWPGDVRRIKNFAGNFRRYRICNTDNSKVPRKRSSAVKTVPSLELFLQGFGEIPTFSSGRNRLDFWSDKDKQTIACIDFIIPASRKDRFGIYELRVAPQADIGNLLHGFIERFQPLESSTTNNAVVERFGWRSRHRSTWAD